MIAPPLSGLKIRCRIITLLILCGFLTGILSCSRWEHFPETFPHQKSMYNARISWHAARSEKGYRISGIYANHSYYYLSDLEIDICLLGSADACLADRTLFFSQLSVDEKTPFQVDMKVPPDQTPQQIKFTYSYRLAEPEMQSPRHYTTFNEPFELSPAP